jgi:hypothetical protein
VEDYVCAKYAGATQTTYFSEKHWRTRPRAIVIELRPRFPWWSDSFNRQPVMLATPNASLQGLTTRMLQQHFHADVGQQIVHLLSNGVDIGPHRHSSLEFAFLGDVLDDLRPGEIVWRAGIRIRCVSVVTPPPLRYVEGDVIRPWGQVPERLSRP